MLQSIRTELKIVGIMVLIIILTVLGWITLLVYEAQDSNIQNIFIEQNNINIQKLPLNAKNYYENYDNSSFKILRNNISEIEKTVAVIKEGGSFEYNQKKYELSRINGREVQQHINAFTREFKTHKDQLQKLVANNLSQGQNDTALIKLKSNAALALDFLADNNEKLIVLNNRIGNSANDFINAERNRTRFILFIDILLIISLAIIGIFMFKVKYLDVVQQMVESSSTKIATSKTENIDNADSLTSIKTILEGAIEGMEDATNFARKIGEGDFSYNLKSSLKNDQLGYALVEMRQKLLSFSEEERRQTWLNNGIAEVTNLLGSHKLEDIEGLSLDFLHYLIKYLNINQGAVFIRSDANSETFDLKACYAFDKKKFVKGQIKTGEGLIGQAIAEESTAYTERVPENYVNITSGLGTATPTVLLIVPIKDKEYVYGAVEFASFNKIQAFEIALIEDACQRFAGILSNLQISINTQNLLNETQRVNQELQHKEEQMRANALQLEKTQKTLNDKLVELESETNLSRNIVEAINKTSATIEFDLDGNILEVNDMYLSIMGYSKDHLIGTNERLLVPDEELDTSRYDLLWNSIKQGSFISGEYKRVSKQGKEIWLNGTYNPIFDVHGTPYKVIQIAQFTTEEKEKDLDYTSKINAISSSYPLIDLDIESKVLSGNATFSEYVGFKRKEFRNRSFHTFLQLSENEHFNQIWKQIINGNVASEVLKFETKEKAEKYALANFNPIYNLSGKIYKVLVILIDITEQKQLEISLTKNKEDLSHTVSELEIVQSHLNTQKQELEVRMRMLNSAAFIFETDLAHEFTSVNKLMCDKLATTRTQLIYKPLSQIIHPELGHQVFESIFTQLEQRVVYRETVPFISFDGTIWWGDTTIAKLQDGNRKTVRFLGIVFDVTQQVQQATSLKESLMLEKAKNAMLKTQKGSSEDALGMLLEQLNIGEGEQSIDTDKVAENQLLPTILIDNNGKIMKLNALAANTLKGPSKQLIKPESNLFEWIEAPNKGIAEFLSLLNDGLLIEQTINIKHDDNKLPFKGVFIPIFSSEKSKSRTLVILTEEF